MTRPDPGNTRGSVTLRGRKQLDRSIVVNAPKATIWAVLADSRLLPQWVSAVDAVTGCSSDGEGLGTSRTCRVNLGGRFRTSIRIPAPAHRVFDYFLDPALIVRWMGDRAAVEARDGGH